MFAGAKRISSGLCGAAALMGVLPLSLHASGKPTQAQIAAIRASCQSDYRANCAGVPAGGSAALACLQKNLANLSPGCQKAVNAAAPATAPPPPAPESPATPYAATTPQSTPATPAEPPAPAPAPSAAPAPAPASAPKPAAKAVPPESYPPMSLREEAMLIRRACGPDYRALCAGERPGGGRIAACLRSNAASLSGPCEAALMAARR